MTGADYIAGRLLLLVVQAGVRVQAQVGADGRACAAMIAHLIRGAADALSDHCGAPVDSPSAVQARRLGREAMIKLLCAAENGDANLDLAESKGTAQ